MAEPGALLEITVSISPGARQVTERRLQLPPGATLGDALAASGLQGALGDAQALSAGVWGRLLPLDHPLRDGDRVELYRPLRVDPKVARRERFKDQGVRAAGLFARKKAGDEAGS